MRRLALVLAMLVAVPFVTAAGPNAKRPTVAVLTAPGLEATDAPAGMDPGHLAEVLADAGMDASLTAPDAIPGTVDVLVNPYGSSYPATEQVEAALASGTSWVNLAGLPFSRPDGQGSSATARAHGFLGRGPEDDVVTGMVPTELGSARAPALQAREPAPAGLVLHTTDPANERPLAVFEDAVLGVEAGPVVVLTTAPHRVVAAGFTGEDSPLAPSAPHADDLLADLVALAADDRPNLTDVTATLAGDTLHVTGDLDGEVPGARLVVEGTGAFPAPARWSPSNPVQQWATVRLVDRARGGQLVDLRRVPANPVQVEVAGDGLLLNGEPWTLTGMSSGGSMPPDADTAQRAEVRRRDYAQMAQAGVTAYRMYSAPTDWDWNAAAANGLLLSPAVGLGWIFQDSAAVVEANLHKATQVGAQARERHNVALIYAGNEFMDHNAPEAVEAIRMSVEEVRRASGGDKLVTYGASHDEPWVLGELPFLDVYSVNCYGATYPLGSPEPGFLHCLLHAKELAANGRPLVVSEWGANTWVADAANMSARSQAGVFVDEVEIARAEFVREKWFQMMQVGTAGGFAFQWADGLGKCLFTREQCTVTDPVSQPGEDQYKPLNHEKYWGFNDAWRNPRLALQALTELYHGSTSPTGLIPPA